MLDLDFQGLDFQDFDFRIIRMIFDIFSLQSHCYCIGLNWTSIDLICLCNLKNKEYNFEQLENNVSNKIKIATFYYLLKNIFQFHWQNFPLKTEKHKF